MNFGITTSRNINVSHPPLKKMITNHFSIFMLLQATFSIFINTTTIIIIYSYLPLSSDLLSAVLVTHGQQWSEI